MDLVSVRELYREKDKYVGKEITVGGWVRSNRDSKNFGFITLNDGTFFETLQVHIVDRGGHMDGLAAFVGAAVACQLPCSCWKVYIPLKLVELKDWGCQILVL